MNWLTHGIRICFVCLFLCQHAAPGQEAETGKAGKAGKEKLIECTGIVKRFEGTVAIGGEGDPPGFILEIEKQGLAQPDKLASSSRTYLKGRDFKTFLNKKVKVKGTQSSISVGGVETPGRTFPVIVVRSIEIVR